MEVLGNGRGRLDFEKWGGGILKNVFKNILTVVRKYGTGEREGSSELGVRKYGSDLGANQSKK